MSGPLFQKTQMAERFTIDHDYDSWGPRVGELIVWPLTDLWGPHVSVSYTIIEKSHVNFFFNPWFFYKFKIVSLFYRITPTKI